MIIRRFAVAILVALVFGAEVAASTQDLIADRLSKAGWDGGAIDAVISLHSKEFDLDAQAGWLEPRLERLARLGRYPEALRMVVRYPEYLDLFVNAAEPGALARVIREIALDRQETERLLNLFIGWPTRTEIGYLQNVLDRHRETVGRFVGTPDLHDVAQVLVLLEAAGAPRAWQDWVATELRSQDSSDRLDEFLVVVELHGGAIARLMEEQPGFENDFPRLWRLFRDLLESRENEEARIQMLAGLLSHRDLWRTLALPHGYQALSNATDWAPVLLLILWGTEGWTQPLEAVGPMLEFREPMTPERQSWLLRELASDDETRRSLAQFGANLRDPEAFWVFALDPSRSEYLDCALMFAQQKSRWDGTSDVPEDFFIRLREYSLLNADALRRMCSDPPSILVRALPGYATVKLVRDLWTGVPIDLMDVVSTASEFYTPSRYLLMLRSGSWATDDMLRITTRMSLDHRRTLRATVSAGGAKAVVPRRIVGRPQGFVIVSDGWLAPVSRENLAQVGGFITEEMLSNLALEGVTGNDFVRSVIIHFRCADSSGSDDPRCK